MTSPPVVVGRYRLDEPLSVDQEASTWRGTDLTTARAIRVCLVGGETGSAARSRRSAVHPGLLPVLDVVRLRDGVVPPLIDARGDTFVVLEPLDGETLQQLVQRRGALESVRAVRLLLAIANGLVAIHGTGSVHGGVVPLAIEVRSLEEGGPRLGLAGVYDGEMAYSSPSRLCDGGPSTHDDAWGLLACLYFAVSGDPPFAAESPQALARRVLGGRPVPIKAEQAPEVELQKMFDRGFSRTAGQRYPDVTSVRDDLRGWLAKHGQSSDAPLVTMAPPPETHTRTTAKGPGPVAHQDYPRAYPTTISGRNHTAPWGMTPTPIPPRPDEPVRAPSLRPGPRRESVPPPPPSDPPSSDPPPTPRSGPTDDETARFSREQLAMLEREAVRPEDDDDGPVAPRAAGRPISIAPRTVDAAMLAATPRRVAIEVAPRGAVIERASPPPRAAPAPRRSVVPFVIGGVLALGVLGGGAAWLLLGRKPPVTSPAVTPEPRTTTAGVRPVESRPSPGVSTSSRPTSVASAPSTPGLASTLPVASAAASSATTASPPSADDLLLCVAKSFPPDTFDPDVDLSFACIERDGRKGAQKLRRAIIAGGRGARITEAMREWSRYRWFELPVYATVRARCCPGAAPVEPPTASATCSGARDALQGVGAAAVSGGPELDTALRQYRRLVSCLMDSGDFPAFGQDGPIGPGEEASFRALVARGKR